MQSILKKVNIQYLLILALFSVSLLAVMLRVSAPAQAAQLTSRSVSLSSNVNSGTATYTFGVTTAATTGGFEFAICTTPLAGTACVGPTGVAVTGIGVSAPSGFILGTAGNVPACGLTTNAAPASSNTVAASGNTSFCAFRIHHPTTAAATGATTITVTALTNPTATGTFFIRIATYAGVNNTYTTFQDFGTVAQSVRAATNVSFRVQEILQVCAGGTTVDATATAMGTGDVCDNTGITGYLSSVDLGVADPTAVRVSPVASGGTTQGNAVNGFVMVRANASNGASIQYRTVQNTSSGELKVAGQSCNATPSSSATDQCINSSPQTQAAGTSSAIIAGTEEFGMAAFGVNRTSGGTTAVTVNGNYDGTGSTGGSCVTASGVDCWTWQHDGTATTLASSSGPIDDEAVLLKFAAAAALTTPTGLYQVNMDIFAVPTY